VCVSIDPRFSNVKENPLLVEGGWPERDEAAVSAGEAGLLHSVNHLDPEEAASFPAGDHSSIPAALGGSKRGLFPLGKYDEDLRSGIGSRLSYISSWAGGWPTGHSKKPKT
jgi:hypothetical protein